MHEGTCQAGLDLVQCARELFASCEEFKTDPDNPANDGVLEEDGTIDLLSGCGGHADPLHYHAEMVCHYNAEDNSQHSVVVGVMNDGRGMYGKWEGT